jgi:hypothetical protein
MWRGNRRRIERFNNASPNDSNRTGLWLGVSI